MKITESVKTVLGKVFTPEVIEKGAVIGGAIMFAVNAINAANQRKTMEHNVFDSVMKKLSEDGAQKINGGS